MRPRRACGVLGPAYRRPLPRRSSPERSLACRDSHLLLLLVLCRVVWYRIFCRCYSLCLVCLATGLSSGRRLAALARCLRASVGREPYLWKLFPGCGRCRSAGPWCHELGVFRSVRGRSLLCFPSSISKSLFSSGSVVSDAVRPGVVALVAVLAAWDAAVFLYVSGLFALKAQRGAAGHQDEGDAAKKSQRVSDALLGDDVL